MADLRMAQLTLPCIPRRDLGGVIYRYCPDTAMPNWRAACTIEPACTINPLINEFEERHESDVPAARANDYHQHERVRVSGLRLLLRRRPLCNAPGRMYEGADATRI
jgi:hypothetical protein